MASSGGNFGWAWKYPPVLAVLLLAASSGWAADNIGGIAVSAAALYTGQTGHGYAETRLVLENDSSKPHTVTLTCPDEYTSYGVGNSISKITRTVTLTPGVTMVVSLLQPPLPSAGDSLVRVRVDGREEGTTRLPNANSHCAFYNRFASPAGVAFISRSLDADGLERTLNHDRAMYSAAMAVGTPDAGSPGPGGKCWMPDTSVSGRTNWLEADYAQPMKGSSLEIHYTQPAVTTGEVELIGVGGRTITNFSLNNGVVAYAGRPAAYGGPSRGGRGPFRGGISGPSGQWVQQFSFPTTSVPVKTVRINFGATPPGTIAVAAVALGTTLGPDWADAARASSENTTGAPASGYGKNPEDIQCMRAEAALSDWSDNWLAYTPFDEVFLEAADLAAMPAPVAAAIGDYLQAGGNVVVFGATNLPATWNPRPAAIHHAGEFTEWDVGFGTGFAIRVASPLQMDSLSMEHVREAVSSSARYWGALPYDSGEANKRLPVVENLTIPVRGITIIMLAFIVIAGPANIFLLARKNRRTWLLWTVPAISLLTTMFIFIYSLWLEGITPNSRIAGMTILDQAGHHAATIGAEGFYCPLTPSDGLRFDNETEATPLVTSDYSSGSAREVDWTQTQHFRRGWVAARVPASFHIRKSEVRRERLDWQKSGGSWQVLNGLGAPIKSLWLMDKDLKFYQAENIPAGQTALLEAAEGPSAPAKLGAGALFRRETYCGTEAGADALNDLQPGTYVAVLDGNPFIENALGAKASAKRTRSVSVVYGILDAPGNP